MTSCEDGSLSDDSGKNVSVSISGNVQKGPFVKGSQLTAFTLNENMVPTGNSFPGSITDDMGSFSISGETDAPYLELRAEGYYFNETTGSLDGPLYLEALVDPSASKVNINVLTTIIKQRVRDLILSGKSYGTAVEQAQNEFVKGFGYDQKLSDFDQMNIAKSSDSDAFLLAVTSVIQTQNSVAEVTALLNQMASDFKDGSLSETLTTLLIDKSKSVRVADIYSNLVSFYNEKNISASIPEFWFFLPERQSDASFVELVSCELVNGAFDVDEQYIHLCNTEYTKEKAESIEQRYGCVKVYTEPHRFDDLNCTLLGGGIIEFELFKTNDISVSLSESFHGVALEEIKINDYHYHYKLSVKPQYSRFSNNVVLQIGNNSYYYINVLKYDYAQLDFTEEKTAVTFDFPNLSQGQYVIMNGVQYGLWPLCPTNHSGGYPAVAFFPYSPDGYDIQYGYPYGQGEVYEYSCGWEGFSDRLSYTYDNFNLSTDKKIITVFILNDFWDITYQNYSYNVIASGKEYPVYFDWFGTFSFIYEGDLEEDILIQYQIGDVILQGVLPAGSIDVALQR